MAIKRTLYIVAMGLFGIVVAASAADDGKLSIEQIMKKAFKGERSLVKKIAQNRATEAERKQFLDYVQSLAAQKPPRGTDQSWKEKTSRLVKAAQSAVNAEPGSPKAVDSAASCKACHRLHKEE